MLNSLDALIIAFMIMSLVSMIGVILIYLVKNEKMKKGLLNFLTVWGMIIAYCGVRSTPSYMISSTIVTWAIGALSVVALLIQLCSKNENRFKIARILATVSVVAGMIDCFMI